MVTVPSPSHSGCGLPGVSLTDTTATGPRRENRPMIITLEYNGGKVRKHKCCSADTRPFTAGYGGCTHSCLVLRSSSLVVWNCSIHWPLWSRQSSSCCCRERTEELTRSRSASMPAWD